MEYSVLTIEGKRYYVIAEEDYRRLRPRSDSNRSSGNGAGPSLPKADADGFFPAQETIRVMIARKIIRRRKAARLSQAELAKRAGVRAETLHRIEQGKHAPTVTTIDKIHKALTQAGV